MLEPFCPWMQTTPFHLLQSLSKIVQDVAPHENDLVIISIVMMGQDVHSFGRLRMSCLGTCFRGWKYKDMYIFEP